MNNAEIKEKKLAKKDVVKAFWKWIFFSHANYNYERLEASAVVMSMSHIIKKLYGDDPKEFKSALKRHMLFYNTEPAIGGAINGMVIAMEEERANGAPITGEAINSLKTGLMGPLAGIGDTIWQGTLIPIFLAFGISLGIQGNLMGPLVYSILIMGISLPVAYIAYVKGYELGQAGIQEILSGGLLQKVVFGASTMGAITIGGLAASFVNVTSPFIIKVGEAEVALQTEVFDQLLLGLLPLTITLGAYYLLTHKKMNATKVLIILISVATVGGLVGIF